MEYSVNFNFISKSKLMQKWFYQQVGYVGDTCFDISENQFIVDDSVKPVMIVARQYYTEFWKTYSSLSLQELKSILKLHRSASNQFNIIQQYYKNSEQDGFDVKTITFSDKLLSLIPSHTILLPETELIHNKENSNVIFQLDTPAGMLFTCKLSDKINSTYKKGLINSIPAFRMSIGIPEVTPLHYVDGTMFLAMLKKGLLEMPIHNLYLFTSFNFKKMVNPIVLHATYWSPLVTAIAFMIMTNIYFTYQNHQLDNKLAEYGDQVEELLEFKKEQDKINDFVSTIDNQIKQYPPVHAHWNIVYQAVKQGMHVQQFRKNENKYILRGLATDSSKVLAAINDLPEVTSATFDGVVRKSRGNDSFIIQFLLLGNNNEG